MLKLRTAVLVIAPYACAALVACTASLEEEVAVTSEPTPTASAPSSPAATPSPKPASPSSAPGAAPAPLASGGGAASEDAPPPSAAPDASADVAPAPTYTCDPVAKYGSAPSKTCAAVQHASSGGSFAVGGYYLSEWWSSNVGVCPGAETRSGTMYIELIGDDAYMRWNIPKKVPSTGTQRLTSNAGKVTRKELCGKFGSNESTWTYSSAWNEIVFTNGTEHEKWTRIPKIIDDGRVPGDPVISP